MFKLIRMAKRGDKLPAEFRQDWLERNRELRKAIGKLIASVVADGNILPGEPAYHGVATLYFPTVAEATAAQGQGGGKDMISLVAMEEKVLFERPGATFKSAGQLKVILTAARKKELTAAQFRDAALKGYAKTDSKLLMESGIQKIAATLAAPEEKSPAFDVMLELYFADADALKAAFGSPIIGTLRKDEEALVDLNAPEIRIVAEEHVL